MKREQLSDIIGNLDDRQIAEAYQFDPGLCGRSPERIGRMKIKRIVTFALAAALILALGVTGYAIYRGRVQDLVMKAPEAEADIVIVGGEENIAAAAEDEIALVDENGDPLPLRAAAMGLTQEEGGSRTDEKKPSIWSLHQTTNISDPGVLVDP